MITGNHRRAILKAIGKKHISKIQAYAVEKQVTKEGGAEFSHSTFSAVLNGRLDHPKIEELIFSCAEHYLERQEEKKGRKSQFLKKVKTKA